MANPSAFEGMWSDDHWREQVLRWVERSLHACGFQQTGDFVLQSERPWSIVIRLTTDQGVMYFKATSPNLRHEAGLTEWLADRYPDLVPEVVAVEPTRGWLLLMDCGSRLRETEEPEALLQAWQELLPAYGRLQQTCQNHVDELLDLGLPDRRLETLPGHLDRWISQLGARVDGDFGLAQSELDRLVQIRPRVEAVCLDLESLKPRPTINHGDLHDNNIGRLPGSLRIFDWGDASLSHPFFSLRTTFVSLERRFDWPEGDQRFWDLCQGYFGAWAGECSQGDLEQALGLAQRIWSMVTALNWEAALTSLPSSQLEVYDDVLPSLMRELLDQF